MPLNLRERQVYAAARRIGLKLIVDSYKADQADARHVVCEPPSGDYEMAMSTRRKTCHDPAIARRHRTSDRRVERTRPARIGV